MILLLSALAILLLTALAWGMGFRNRPTLDESAACAEAEGRIAGFRAAAVALADGGRGAIVRGLDGSLVLVLPLGDGWLTRSLPRHVATHVSGQVMEIALGEPMLRRIRLPMAARPLWLEEALA
ncbi:hypothetical protein [Sandaracinobacteroides hominis]|uniref:hypothetical protein n=1 Tax=Sandaracinobacteroides hominis TaxID=2780086 RepID=UPI0018F337AC|nr:hypothetical protein [Sandaracinobacteroides hominis]